MVTYDDIVAARERIAGGVEVTPCDRSANLSSLLGCEIYCKLESLQATGSFKERGARNALLQLDTAQRQQGVIAASAGNHALALAWHGEKLGIPVTVVMPQFAPLIKQVRCRRLGARVILEGDTFTAARAAADAIRLREGQRYVHGFDDPAIIAGQGTLGLEILEQVPDCEAIVVPIGGAGLIGGVALAVHHAAPQVEVIGVEPEVSPSFGISLQEGVATEVPLHPTLADGLAVARVGPHAFEVARHCVHRVVTVSEAAIAQAVVRHMELEKCVVEGAAATPLAALLAGKLPELKGRKVVLLVSGGNIDLTVLERLIETALVADGRRLRFTTIISDRPGGLARLATLLAETGVSVLDIFHDRAFSGPNVSQVRVVCTVETRDRPHQSEVLARLTQAGLLAAELPDVLAGK
jgi:threonine dehydratase